MTQKMFRWVSPSPFRFISLPNLVSYLSLVAAIAAMQLAMDGRWGAVGAAIGLSALADMLDGKFARLFKREPDESKFGGELDSLIDVVAFGAAPVLCLRMYYFPEAPMAQAIWAMAAVWYILAVITRLGYFNVYSMTSGTSFVGLPTTMVGILWSAIWIYRPALLYAPVPFIALGVLMLLPVQFDRLRGWKFLLLPAITLACVLGNLLRD